MPGPDLPADGSPLSAWDEVLEVDMGGGGIRRMTRRELADKLCADLLDEHGQLKDPLF
jgi:hypothetical protein